VSLDIQFWLEASFWAVAVVVLLAPLRWALPAYLVLGHLDLSAAAISPATQVGVENAVKVVLLPVVLALRCGRPRGNSGALIPLATMWWLLVAYAALATLWAPQRLPALKMVGYLGAYAVIFNVFLAAWRRRVLRSSGVLAALWVGLALAGVQTWVVPGWLPATEQRFTSFVPPQSFAAFLLCMLALMLFSEHHAPSRWIHVAAAVVAILLAGSRYVLFGAAMLLLIAWGAHLARTRSLQAAGARVAGGLLGAVVAVGLLQTYLWLFPASRLAELREQDPFGWKIWERPGTWSWRAVIYRDAASDLAGRDWNELMFGSGTSSAAEYRLTRSGRIDAAQVDANRVLHNEFLRAAYEWGLVGLLLLGGFVVALLRQALRQVRRRPDRLRAWAALAITPALVLGLCVENLLSASATAGGLGYALVLAFSFAQPRSSTETAWVSFAAAPHAGQRALAAR
jgi:hypothetical protein